MTKDDPLMDEVYTHDDGTKYIIGTHVVPDVYRCPTCGTTRDSIGLHKIFVEVIEEAK